MHGKEDKVNAACNGDSILSILDVLILIKMFSRKKSQVTTKTLKPQMLL